MSKNPKSRLSFFGFLVNAAFVILPLLTVWIFKPVIDYNEAMKRAVGSVTEITATNEVSKRRETENSPIVIEKEASLFLSIVFPAYNEEARLPVTMKATLAYLRRHWTAPNLNYELLIVDDGSTDKTIEVALGYGAELADDQLRILKLPQNRGKGAALKAGVERAKGKYILIADADGATDIEDTAKLIDKLKDIEKIGKDGSSSLGVAIGSRAHLEGKSIATRAFYRTILMRGFHLLVMLLCTRNIKDTQCGFKLFTRKAAQILFNNLHLQTWAFDIELIYVAEMLGIPLTEVAVNWTEIEGSKLIQTKLDVVKTSLNMARDMLCVRLAYLFGIWKPSVQTV